MCQLFIGANSDLWLSETKSLRIDGVVTSIRIEKFFWTTLSEIAFRDEMTVNQLITKLYHESIDAEHDLGNFTSFLRVCCSRYHALQAAGDLTSSLNESLGQVDATTILEREQNRLEQVTLQIASPSVNSKIN